ncbi:MAG TPA: MFS transporter [Candidatus Limnocylindrales bacterium]
MHVREPAPSYRALFAIPTLGRILLGMALSRIGGSMLGVTIVLFTLQEFRSPALAGLVTFASVAPGLFVSPIVGALLDRHGRARLIILDQLVGASALTLIAVLALTDVLTPLVLVLVTGVAGLTAPLSSVGLRTIFPLIVPKRLWERVNALDSNGYVVATLIGPPAAGLLVQVVGGPQTLIAIALLFVISAVVFVGITDPVTVTASTGKLLVDAWQGLRYTLHNPTLRALGLSLTIMNLGWGIVTIVIPVLVLRDMGLGAIVVGVVFAVSGVTGGIGALVAGRWQTQGRERSMLVWPMAGMAITAGALLVSPTLPVLVAVMAIQGLLNGPMDIAMFTLRQRRTDPAWMGRAFAISMAMNFMGYPFGSAIGGALVGIGTDVAIAAAVVFTALGAIVAWLLLPRVAPAP